MIAGKRVLAVIPARGGSKGVPRKNVRALAGKPLIAWTIEVADASAFVDRVVLSSDDTEIMKVAAEYGCDIPFVRPAELARDDTPGIEPVLHALEMIPGYEMVVVLQPTSPLRIVADVDGCIARCVEIGAPACVTVSEADPHPMWTLRSDGSGRLAPFCGGDLLPARRQDLPAAFALNGAVYAAEVTWLRRTHSFFGNGVVGYVMPSSRSLDIDSDDDLLIAECLMKRVSRE